MKKPAVVVTLVSLFVLIYQLSPFLGFAEHLIFRMYLLSPFLLGYMAYIIIRYGKGPSQTFEDAFYEDYPAK
jgi:hypothetical protein